MQIKTISLLGLASVLVATTANAAYSDKTFRREVLNGLDVVSVKKTIKTAAPDAPGELGYEVYQTLGVAENDGIRVFVPAAMYMRMGGGISLGFASDRAVFGDEKYEANNGYFSQIGLGWNLSSYVRGELGIQNETLKFSELTDYAATYNTLNAMLYFDFARRYVQMGDITYRRRFVPFMGIGAGTGWYAFDGANGANGFIITAPRAELGFTVMLNEVIGLDIAYQYQMLIGNGFGWGVYPGGVQSLSNVVASFKVNF